MRQEPSVAYTVAGTGLTMTGTIASSDDFYVVFQGKAQQTTTLPENITASTTFGGGSHLQGMRHLAKPCRVVHRLPPYLARQPWILIASKILF